MPEAVAAIGRKCPVCGTTSSTQWRKPPGEAGHILCDDCGKRVWQQRAESLQQQQQQPLQPQQQPLHEQPRDQPAVGTAAVRQCTHCGFLQPGPAGRQYYWRRHPTTREQLCAPCGRYADKHGGELPELLEEEEQEDSEEQQDEDSEEDEEEHPQRQPPQRQCLQCGSTSKGSAKWAGWHRHPASGEEWLCHPCYRKVHNAIKRQQRQAEKQAQQEVESEVEPDEEEQSEEEEEEAAIAAAVKQCTHCGSLRPGPPGTKYSWRRHPTSKEQLCGRCWGHAHRHGGELPALSDAEGEQEQSEEEEEEQPPQQPQERQCLQCASPTKGSGRWATWHRHPATGEEWLCQPCFNKARAAIKRQQRQPEKHPQEVESEEEEAQSEEEEEEEQLQQQPPQRQCLQCGSTSKGSSKSAGWHRHPATGEEWLCQPCFNKARTAAMRQQRQPEKHWQEVESEEEEAQSEEEEEEEQPQQQPQQRQCLQCGSTSKGSTKSAGWHRHPATGEEWLCHPCYRKVHNAIKRQQRQAEKQAQQEEKSEVEPEGEEQSEEEEAAVAAAVKQCTHCGSLRPGPPGTSYSWRWHPTSKEQLCGPCCGYSDRHGGELPVVAWKEAAAAATNQPKKKQQGKRKQHGRQPPAAPAVDEEPPVSPRQHKQQRVADAATAVGAEGQSDAGAAGEQRLCSHCGADHAGPTPTYPWRKHATTGARLCKDCWDFSRKHYGFLPELPQPAEPPQPSQPEGQEEQPAAGKGRQRSGTRWASGQEQGDAAAGDAEALQAPVLLSLPGRRVTRHQQHQQEEQQHGAVEVEAQAATAAGQASRRRRRLSEVEGEAAAEEQQQPPSASEHKRGRRQLVQAEQEQTALLGSMHKRGCRQQEEQAEDTAEAEAGEKQKEQAAEPAAKRRRGKQQEVPEPPAAAVAAAPAEPVGASQASDSAGATGRGGGECRWVNADSTGEPLSACVSLPHLSHAV